MDALSTTKLSACNVTNQGPSVEAADPPAGELRIPWPWGGGGGLRYPKSLIVDCVCVNVCLYVNL